jgi:hypothetical protein
LVPLKERGVVINVLQQKTKRKKERKNASSLYFSSHLYISNDINITQFRVRQRSPLTVYVIFQSK